MTTPETAAAGADVVDVAVIGAGLVGCALARELSGYRLSVALLDERHDVGDSTSKANTAILHTGFDAKPGTLESRMVREGYVRLGRWAEDTGIPVERTGALLVAWDDEQLSALPGLLQRARDNGYDSCQLVDRAEVYGQVPALADGALGGLTVPGECVTCTWTVTLALAVDAVRRGTRLVLGRRVQGAAVGPRSTTLSTSGAPVRARWVVNAAGLGSDAVDAMFGYDRFHITPRRGELLVYDKLARRLVDRIVLPVPTSRGKGVLITPTIYGNVMLGPTAEDRADRTDTSTSETGFEFLLERGRRIMPELVDEEVTAAYAGLRAASEHDDFVVDVDRSQRYAVAGGIRSTGMTACMAIARHLSDRMADAGLELRPRSGLPDPPSMPNLGESFPRPYQRPDLIAADPAYGHVVCFCERVTAGEIRDAFSSPVPPSSLSGLRRRTRAMNGRCQGFYCGAEITRRFEAARG